MCSLLFQVMIQLLGCLAVWGLFGLDEGGDFLILILVLVSLSVIEFKKPRTRDVRITLGKFCSLRKRLSSDDRSKGSRFWRRFSMVRD